MTVIDSVSISRRNFKNDEIPRESDANGVNGLPRDENSSSEWFQALCLGFTNVAV
jgi:hypothetical protein